ncbi:MAG: S8 family serine peptidase [Deltaproteobacteria bacterium]|nr:S8 family serine peptidase [Deltaproteobacteria bacterium]
MASSIALSEGGVPIDAMEAGMAMAEPTLPVPRSSAALRRRPTWPRDFGASFDARHVHLNAIVIKVADGVGIRLRSGVFARPPEARRPDDLARLDALSVRASEATDADVRLQQMLRTAGVTSVMSLVRQADEVQAEQLRQRNEAGSGTEFEDMASFFMLTLPREDEAATREALTALRTLPFVEYAYAQPHASGPRTTPACTDQLPGITPLMPSNGLPRYQAVPPPTVVGFTSPPGTIAAGHDVAFARATPGGNGSGVVVTDVEAAMELEHEDLPAMASAYVALLDQQHGTAVMGILVGCDNGFGTRGIAPAATPHFYSSVPWPAVGINSAVSVTPPGNVILVEVQMDNFSTNGCYTCQGSQVCLGWVPVEFYPGEHAAIRSATQSGRIVVEPAANAQKDLDFFPDLRRTPTDPTKFSGAVMVGGVMTGDASDGQHATACSGEPGSEAIAGSNAGSRLDLSAWYSQVDTLGYGNGNPSWDYRHNTDNPSDPRQWYTDKFSGTSSASAIIAGGLTSLVGMYRAHNGSATNAPMPAEFLGRTGRRQILLAGGGPSVGPTLQLGMAAAAFRDRTMGDSDPTTLSALQSATNVQDRVLVVGRKPNGHANYNVLRGGAWYGWADLPLWQSAVVGAEVSTLTIAPTVAKVDAFHVDSSGRLVVARMENIDPVALPGSPAIGFGAWALATASEPGGLVSATPVVFFAGYEEVFARTSTGGLRWYYRSSAAGGSFVASNVTMPSPITIGSTLKAVVPVPGRVDLYALNTAGALFRATSINGGALVGWTAVPGASGGITHFDVARISPSRVLVAVAWSGGTSVLVHDVNNNTVVSSSQADTQLSTSVSVVSELVNGVARLVSRRANGTVDARTIYNGTILSTGTAYAFDSVNPGSRVLTVPWQRQVALAMVLGGDSRPRFRVLDALYPRN